MVYHGISDAKQRTYGLRHFVMDNGFTCMCVVVRKSAFESTCGAECFRDRVSLPVGWLVGVCVMIDGALRWMQAIAKGNRERPYLNTRSANNDTLITYSPFAA